MKGPPANREGGLAYSPYELRQKAALNRVDLTAVREGMLIKIGEGYGCIHPWVELGDPSLEACVSELKSGRVNSDLVRRALDSTQVIREDVWDEFKEKKRRVKSHATLPKLAFSAVEAAVEAGFTAVKYKRGKDWMRLRKKTAEIMNSFPELRWRVDFNGALEKPLDLHQFLGAVPADRIDYIEDPFSEVRHVEEWRGVPLGYDRVIPDTLNLSQNYLIAKPALQSREEITELSAGFPDRVVFTSYMDHVIGQLYALHEAEAFYTENGVENPPLGGLSTHGLYEENAYASLLGKPVKIIDELPSFSLLHKILEKENWRS